MVYQVLVMPVLLYGAECWTMRKEDERRLLTMEMSWLRRMLGVTRLNRIKKRRNQKKSKPTRDSSRSDKKETSRVVWPRIKNVRRQTANQSTILLYTGKTQQRSSMQEVDQQHTRGPESFIIIIIIIERKDLGGIMSKRLQGHLTTLKTVPKRECDAK